jgi:hypothetical protein
VSKELARFHDDGTIEPTDEAEAKVETEEAREGATA